MRRRWFGIVLMLWASVAPLLAFAPTALADGEQYSFTGGNIQGSGGSYNGTVTFNSIGGGVYQFTILTGGSSKLGPTEYSYDITGLKKNAAATGGYSGKVTCTASDSGVGGACPSLTSPITIADPNGTGPGGGNKTPPSAPPPAAAGAAAQATCTAGALGWVMCPLINLMVELVGWIETNFLVPFLQEPPFDQHAPAIAPVYAIWGAFRNVASVFFILVFFLVIFGTAIGFDNYTVKKIMPHLIAGAVLVPFSWYICAAGIDIGNVLGQGLVALCNSIIPVPHIDFGTNLETVFYAAGTGILAATVGALALAGMSLGLLFTIVIAATATYFTLILRKILIILMVVLSPFALLAWILPNTQKLFKMWYSNFMRLILMYPLIMLLFEGGRLFATVSGAVTGAGSSTAAPLFQLTGLFLPLAMVPWTFSMAGGAMKAGTGAIGKVSGAANKKYGRGSESDKKRHENFQNKRAFNATSGNAFMRGLARKQSSTGGFVMNGSGLAIGKKGEDGKRARVFGQTDQTKSEMMDKADKYRSLNDKVTGYDEANKHSPINKERQLQAGTNVAAGKAIEARANEVLHMNATIDNVEVSKGKFAPVNAQVGQHGLGETQREYFKKAAEDAIDKGDQGTAAGYLKALSKSESGRDIMSGIKQDKLGWNDVQSVKAEYQEMWDVASEGVDKNKDPGLLKGKKSAYTDMTPAAYMQMSPNAKGRYHDWTKEEGNERYRDEAGNAIGTALRSDRTRERLNDEDYREMHKFIQSTEGLQALLKSNGSQKDPQAITDEHVAYIASRVGAATKP